MNGTDIWIRRGTATSVLAVAAIAATVSFVHIQHLAWTHGQTRLAAVLLPLSIDGTVAASSLVLLRAARAQTAAPWLAQAMLASAVLATLAANVGYGWRWGWAGAALSGWPAYAFIGCTEMAIGMVRRAARPAEPVSVAVFVKRRLPTVREIQARRNCGQQTAEKAREEVRLDRRIRDTESVGASPVAPTGGGRGTPPIPPAAAPLKNGGRDAKVTVPATQNGSGPRE